MSRSSFAHIDFDVAEFPEESISRASLNALIARADLASTGSCASIASRSRSTALATVRASRGDVALFVPLPRLRGAITLDTKQTGKLVGH